MMVVSGDMTRSNDHSTVLKQLSINLKSNNSKPYNISQDKSPSHPKKYQTSKEGNDNWVWWKKAFWKFLLSVLFPLPLAVPLPSPDPAPAPAPVLSPSQTPGPAMTPSVSYAYLPYATNYGYNVPVVPVDHQEDPDRSRSSPEGLTELDYHSEAARLASFHTWELTFISPADFARAGFYSLNQHDSCRCAFCHNCVGDWVEGDDPMTEHRALFPLCPFVQGHEVGNIPLEVQGEGGHQPTRQSPGNDETGIRWNSNHTEPNTTPEKAPYGASPESIGIMKHAGPLHPQYAALKARLRTSREWRPALRQQPKQLAEAEFYYIGLSDQVKCFYCDGGLRNWQSEDEPWVEHARWFSRCVFIRLVVRHQQSIRTPNPPGKPAI